MADAKLQITYKRVDDLIPYVNNSRTHTELQVNQIAASISEFGFRAPILIDGKNGIIAGHGRVLAANKLGIKEIPTIDGSDMTEVQKRMYVIADNKIALNAGWDEELLMLEIDDLREMGADIDLLGFDEAELKAFDDDENDAGEGEIGNASLSDRFLIPPFTVFNAREGWWQNRKRSWLALGIKSEEGRDIGSTNVGSKAPEYMQGRGNNEGGSIFDPVLCEIAYRWFCPENGIILDPFAGGSVRGVVASKLDRQYIGHELRAEQVTANMKQGAELCADDQYPPAWIAGDSLNIDKTCKDVKADFVFSCPPYADLEVYSDNPSDLSNMEYAKFKQVYAEIIKKTCAQLKNDRFACFVVGDVRDNNGNYYNFVGDTIQAFLDAGLKYYNEAVLVTCVGTLPIRSAKTFTASRKLGKTHQNVLVFVKGDGKKATQACGQIEIAEDLFPEEVND